MVFAKAALLLACVVAATAIAPIEELFVPKPYSFGYAIKDKHGEQHRQEVGDGLHNVKGSYGFKDERGIERQVNYVADKGGFRAEVKTNEPGTAPLNPAAVKMESSAHPYFGMAKGPVAAGVAAKEGLALAGGFGFPGLLKLDAAKRGLAFDFGLAKENELEKEAMLAKEGLAFGAEIGLEKAAKEGFAFSPLVAEGLAKEGFAFSPVVAEGLAKEGFAFSPLVAEGLAKEGFALYPLAVEGLAKEAEAAKSVVNGFGLEELLKEGFALVPAEKESTLEKEGLALATALNTEELAKPGLAYSPLFASSAAFGLKEAELEKEGLTLEKLKETFPFAPKFVNAPLPLLAPLPYAAPKPKGFAYGGPVKGGFVKGYDARYF